MFTSYTFTDPSLISLVVLALLSCSACSVCQYAVACSLLEPVYDETFS